MLSLICSTGMSSTVMPLIKTTPPKIISQLKHL
jgi:hypothetical protein